MARDQDPKTARIYDRRTVDRNIKKGLLTRKDFEKHLKALEDVAEKGVSAPSPTSTTTMTSTRSTMRPTRAAPSPRPVPPAIS